MKDHPERVMMYGARFSTGIYTQRCHWFPRLFTLQVSMRVYIYIPLEVHLLLSLPS
jgi:hypothetical protein